jgi:DNA repair exonuclease SbcCD nuclease subunit
VFQFLHAADIHLDSPLRGLARYEGAPVEEIRAATRRAFENLVSLAIQEAVAFVVIAGDLYDGDWKDYNTGLFFNRQMGRLAEAGIRVFVVAGNHDAASQISKALRPPGNVHFFSTEAAETVALEALGVALHGRGFATREVIEDLSLDFPAALPGLFNLGVLHTSLNGRPGHEPYAPCHLDGLRSKGYQYWALGHVHQREVVSAEPWIVFPGNIQGRHARETGPKGCSLVTVSDHSVQQVEHRDLDVLRWQVCEVDLAGVADLDEALERIAEALRAAEREAEGRLLAARLRLTGASAAHGRLHAERGRVEAECRALAGSNAWLEKLEIDTRPEVESGPETAQTVLGDLLATVQGLDPQVAPLDELAAELQDLRRKLPHELLSGAEPFDPTDVETLRGELEDVKALLMERLLSRYSGT